MNNRKKIEQFAKKNNLNIIRCEYIRNREYMFGDRDDSSCWIVEFEKLGYYESYNGYGVNDDVDMMLNEIMYDIKEET